MAIEVKHGTGAAATAAAAFGGAQGQARGRLEKERIRSYERQKEADRQRWFTAERDQWLAGETEYRMRLNAKLQAEAAEAAQDRRHEDIVFQGDEDARRAQQERDRIARQVGLPEGYDPEFYEMVPDEMAIQEAEKAVQAVEEEYRKGHLDRDEYEVGMRQAQEKVRRANERRPRRKKPGQEINGRRLGETFTESGFVFTVERDAHGNLYNKKVGDDRSVMTHTDKIKYWDLAKDFAMEDEINETDGIPTGRQTLNIEKAREYFKAMTGEESPGLPGQKKPDPAGSHDAGDVKPSPQVAQLQSKVDMWRVKRFKLMTDDGKIVDVTRPDGAKEYIEDIMRRYPDITKVPPSLREHLPALLGVAGGTL
jgi:hypothetical protein